MSQLLHAQGRELQGHQQDKIHFGLPSTYNDGNFSSILRLLAKSNIDLKEHLASGPKNAKYASNTIQNEIFDNAADIIRKYYRKCLKKSSHFIIIANEVTSHGKEILQCVYVSWI